MRNPGGYMVWEGWHGEVEENDTFTCGHGNEIVKVPAGTPMVTVGQFCRVCGSHICDKCAAIMNRTLQCRPFEKWLDRKEGKRHAHELALAAEQRAEAEEKYRRVVLLREWPSDAAALEFRARVDDQRNSLRRRTG